jgi:hypothetical protein
MSLRFPRIVGVAGGLSFLAFGAWAMLDPSSFFERVARFDPYNQHFVQDIGAFQLGLGAVLLLVTLRPALESLTIALLGTGVGATAHAISHVVGRDLGGRPASDIPTFATLAALLVGAGLWQARASRATSEGVERARR